MNYFKIFLFLFFITEGHEFSGKNIPQDSREGKSRSHSKD